MHEPLPLARIQEAVLEFLRNQNDAALFEAQAVNAYVDEPRMTRDVDILCMRASELAQELRLYLAETFNAAIRVREVAGGNGFRIFQLRRPKNRYLADVRHVDHLPPTQLIADIRVPLPEELIAQKVIALARRSGQPKGDTDRRDLKLLLLAYPQFKRSDGPVRERLLAGGADAAALELWDELAHAEIIETDEDAGY